MNSLAYLAALFAGPRGKAPTPTEFARESEALLPVPTQDEDHDTLYVSAQRGLLPGDRLRISVSHREPPRLAALRRSNSTASPPYDTGFAGHAALQVPLPDSPLLVGVDEQWLEGVDSGDLQHDALALAEELEGERRLHAKEKERLTLEHASRSWPVRYTVGLYLLLRKLLSFVGLSYASSAGHSSLLLTPVVAPPPIPRVEPTSIDEKDELADKLAAPPPLPTRTSSSFFFRSLPHSRPDSLMLSTPPPRAPRLIPKTLVLDLDETLIHSTSRPYPLKGTRGAGLKVRIVEVVLDGRSTVYTVYKRPWVDFFLRKVRRPSHALR